MKRRRLMDYKVVFKLKRQYLRFRAYFIYRIDLERDEPARPRLGGDCSRGNIMRWWWSGGRYGRLFRLVKSVSDVNTDYLHASFERPGRRSKPFVQNCFPCIIQKSCTFNNGLMFNPSCSCAFLKIEWCQWWNVYLQFDF